MNESTAAKAGQYMASGAAWMIALRWIMRSLNFVVVIVLARLLAPEDFGIFAIAFIVLGVIELVGEGGLEFGLIHQEDPSEEHLRSAWTLQVMLGLATGAFVFLTAPFFATFFNEPRAEFVLQVLALRSVLMGFNNIGIVYFLKDFEFHKEFQFNIALGLLEGLITIGLAFVLQNYMALVYGSVFSALVAVVLSYMVHPCRPGISFSKISQIWAFSGWVVLADLAEEAVGVIDRFVVGFVSATSTLGIYHMAASIGNTMFDNTVYPLWRGLFPSYARMANKPRYLAKAFLAVFGWVLLLACAVGFGIAGVANELVLALLGDRWAPAIPLVPWLSLAAAIAAIVDNPLLVLTALGHTRLCAAQSLGRLLLMACVLPLVAINLGLEAMAIALFAASLLYLPIQIYLFTSHTPVTLEALAALSWRPLLGGFAMFLAVRLVASSLPLSAISALVIEMLVGAAVYIGAVLALWWLAGKPSGPEAVFLEKLARYSPVALKFRIS